MIIWRVKVRSIKPRDIKKLKIKKIKNVYWREDLSDIIPTVMYGKEYLQKGVDYVIDVPDMLSDEYLAVFDIMDNTKKIPVTMTIKLTGNNPNYADYSKDNSGRKVRFYVTRRNIKDCMTMSVVGTYSEINGEVKPNISLKYVNDELVEGKDYKVTYRIKRNKKNGVVEAIANVKGIGLYTGNTSYKWYLYQED